VLHRFCVAIKCNVSRAWEELQQWGGLNIEFEKTSLLFVMYDDIDVAFAKALLAKFPRDQSLMEWVTTDELAECEPAVTANNRGALRFISDDQVNPYRFADAMRAGARSRGATTVTHTEVTGLRVEGGRVVGVETRNGYYPAGAVVNAAGSWAPMIGRMVGLEIPVKPVRGQIVGTETLPEVLNACISTSDCYIAQKQHGEIIIGSTTEEVGYDTGNTPEAMQYLAAGAIRALPFLENVAVKRVWSGLRPGTPDELPILGSVDGIEGYFNACGHFRTGILNAPLTGQIIAELLAGEEPSFPIQPFLMSRFDHTKIDDEEESREAAPLIGGVGYSSKRTSRLTRDTYVAAFMKWVGETWSVQNDTTLSRNEDFMDAVVAGCVLVAAADDVIDTNEAHAMCDYIQKNNILRQFNKSDIVERFDQYVNTFVFNSTMGENQALRSIAKMKIDPALARIVVRLCCSIGAADGYFDPKEVQVVRSICQELGLQPSEFMLG
jgi:hydrogen cyanide synthase HcnC